MRKLSKLSMPTILMLLLASCALGGIIETPPAPQPPPDELVALGDAQSTVDNPRTTPASQPVADLRDSMADAAMRLMQSVLTIF